MRYTFLGLCRPCQTSTAPICTPLFHQHLMWQRYALAVDPLWHPSSTTCLQAPQANCPQDTHLPQAHRCPPHETLRHWCCLQPPWLPAPAPQSAWTPARHSSTWGQFRTTANVSRDARPHAHARACIVLLCIVLTHITCSISSITALSMALTLWLVVRTSLQPHSYLYRSVQDYDLLRRIDCYRD